MKLVSVISFKIKHKIKLTILPPGYKIFKNYSISLLLSTKESLIHNKMLLIDKTVLLIEIFTLEYKVSMSNTILNKT